MTILSIKIAVLGLCMILKLIGELKWHNAQRYILPIIYSGAVSYNSGCWWLGLTTLPMIAGLVMGYKVYGKTDSVARALWLFIICIMASFGPFLTHHLAWYVFFPYIVAAGFVGTLTRNINNWLGAPINGFTIAFPILFIH